MQQVLKLEEQSRRPEDYEALLRAQNQLIEQQNRQIRQLVQRLTEIACELAALKGQAQGRQLEMEVLRLNAELEKLRGHQSERREHLPEGNEAPKKPARSGHGPSEQPQLETELVVVPLDEADQVCPRCGEELQPWEGQAESRTQIDVVPARYVVKEYLVQKYRCVGCRHIESAELSPEQRPLQPGGRYSVDFALQVAADKYLDHLPLERQVRRMARLGLMVESSTLYDQLRALSTLLRPTWLALSDRILAQDVIGMDQTGWAHLEGRKGKRDNFQLWSLASHEAVFYSFEEHKDTQTAVRLLKNYSGWIVCDDLSTHTAAAREGPFRLAACMAHVRRRFIECDSPRATPILDWIGQLYQIEKEIGPQSDRSKDELRRQRRNIESRAIMVEMKAYLCRQTDSPKSQFSKAVAHALKRWPLLTPYLDEPQLWIDNNLTERSLRGPVVGRRNHFGSKTKQSSEVAAILYSLFETAKLNGVDPVAYVRQVVLNARDNPKAVTFPQV